MIDLANGIRTDHRAGRMLEAMLGSEHKGAKVVLTTDVMGLDGSSRFHQTFMLRRWVGREGSLMVSVSVAGSGDWACGIKPITMMHLDLTKLVVVEARDARNTDPMLRYAAEAAVGFAFLGEAGLPQPKNGSVTVLEESVCGDCGIRLRDPVSIERGRGPICAGKATGTRTILGRAS